MRSWRSDAGCSRAPPPVTCGPASETRGRAAGMKSDLAGWCFAGPALLVIAVFFVVPVAAALALSLTDFDIYAIAVSLATAVLLDSELARFKGVFRTALFAPVVTTVVAVAVVWRNLLHARYGWINHALGAMGIAPIDWLGDPHWSMPAIILFAVWKNFGINMIIFVAALQAIPRDLYEAARIEGASAAQQFWRVTLPLLAPTPPMVGVVTIVSYFYGWV